MDAEPVILGEPPADDYPEIEVVADEKVYTKADLDRACARARRKAEKLAAEARAEADQLRAELDRLKNPPASIPLDDLDRPISFEAFDEMVKAQIRPLRQWLSIDWRLKEK